MTRRWGISLVELLAVLTGCSIVLGLTAALLHQTMRSQTQTRRFFETERTAERLAQHFRSDVHAAAGIAIGDATSGADDRLLLSLQRADGVDVEYRRAGKLIVRTSKTVEADIATRETYALSEAMRVELREQATPAGWALIITTPRPAIDGPTRTADIGHSPVWLHVVAVAGHDFRHRDAANGEEVAP